jgi:chitin disaccharide deacetylase
MIIINSDDFGISSPTNKAIVTAITSGLCSSTTLMPNMPGFDEACSLTHEHRLEQHIGMHLVLRDGFPLTEEIRKCRRFCDRDGRLALEASPPLFTLIASEQQALAKEIRAQINRCRTNGVQITHLDSHYHLHNLWPVLDVVLAVAASEKIPHVRIARNCGLGIGLKKRIYKTLVNNKIRRAALARTTHFGSLADYLFLVAEEPISCKEPFEIMIHAVIHEKGFVADAGDDQPLEDRIKAVPFFSPLVSFSGARYLGNGQA